MPIPLPTTSADYAAWSQAHAAWAAVWATAGAAVAALIAGGLTYLIGRKQVNALKEQLTAIRDQQSTQDRRSRQALLDALTMEAARVKMLIELRNIPNVKGATPVDRMALAQANVIELTIDIRHDQTLSALVMAETAAVARELVARVDQWNAAIQEGVGRGAVRDDFSDVGQKAFWAATELQKAIVQERLKAER